MGLFVFIALSLNSRFGRAESPSGAYVGTVGGQRVELRLLPGGGASLLGEKGSWQSNTAGVILSSSRGSVQAYLKAGVIRFTVDGVRFQLRKQSAGAGRGTAAGVTARPYSPGKLLKGKRYKIKGVDASFILPRGWKATPITRGGESGIAISNRNYKEVGIFLTSKMLSAQESAATIPQLLQKSANEALGQTPMQIVASPSSFSVDGKDAGMMILEGSDGIRRYRVRTAGIRVERWGAVFLALYDSKLDREIAPVFDTVVATFRGKAPKPNKALQVRIAGCWQKYDRDSGSTGASVHSSTYRFDRNGNYSHRYFMNVSIPGGAGVSDNSEDTGRFSIIGNQLMLQSNTRESSNRTVGFQRGILFMGSNRYIPCS